MDNLDYYLVDTETTGVTKTDCVCEIAFLRIDNQCKVLGEGYSLINPQKQIHYAASAVNGITDEMVADAPTITEYMESIGNPFLFRDVVFIAHNASFDHGMLKDFVHEEAKILDTLRLSRILYPHADSHKQAVLASMLGVKVAREKAHSADGDLDVLRQILECMCRDAKTNVFGLLDVQKQPVPILKMPFGKHRGSKLSELPKDYISWLLNKATIEEDLRAALFAL